VLPEQLELKEVMEHQVAWESADLQDLVVQLVLQDLAEQRVQQVQLVQQVRKVCKELKVMQERRVQRELLVRREQRVLQV
jgi:hypothetical protein